MRTTRPGTRLGPRWVWVAALPTLLFLPPAGLRAQTDYAWNVGNGTWAAAANWTPSGGPPGMNDNATIGIAGTYTVTLDSNRSINNVTLNNSTATISHAGGAGGNTLTVGGTITLTSGLYSLGNGVISGGSITSGGGTLQGTTLTSRLNNVTIGSGVLDFGTAFRSVLLQGTSNFGAGATIDLSAGSTGLGFEQTVTHNNLTINLTAANSIVEVNGNHTVTFGPNTTITNNTASGTNEIGSDNFAPGTSTVQNQGLIRNTAAGQLSITADNFRNQSGGIVRSSAGTVVITSPGEINQAGGTFDVNGGTLTLGGANWDNNGTITLSSGTLNLGGSFATANIGTVTRTGGSVQITGNMNNAAATLALNASTGSYILGTTLTAPVTTGTITGGSITAADGSTLRVGPSPNNRLTDVAVGVGVLDFGIGSGQVRLAGTTTLAAGAVVNLSGGMNVLGFDQTATLNDLTVNFTSINSRVRVENARTVTLGSNVTITNSSGGTATLDTGVSATAALVNQGLIRNTTGTILNVGSTGLTFTNNGTLQATGGQLRVLDAANFTNFSAGTLTGGTYLAQGATLSFQTRLVSTIAAGTTVEMSGAAVFAAMDSLATNAGTFRVTGGQSFNPSNTSSITNTGVIEIGAASTLTSDLTVNGGGSLRGSGTLAGNVTYDTTGGTLAPGTSPGVLTVTGDLTLNGNTTFQVELNGATAGTGYDQLTVNGGVTLGNAVLAPTLGYTPGAGDRLFILNKTSAGNIPDTFAGLPDGSPVTVGGYTATISYFGDFGSMSTSGGNDVVLYNFTPVAEPEAALAAAAGAVVGFGCMRRRRWTEAGFGGSRLLRS